MNTATRRKVSYVVSFSNEEQAHCLGVNSLAIDTTKDGGILYSAGRDGVVASWHLNFTQAKDKTTTDDSRKTTCKAFSQMHTDWVNDIVLCQAGTCVVSASNDRTIKLWKPYSDTPKTAHTIGHHMDYAKCLTYASQPGWVASGGLDRCINIWDIEKTEASITIDAGPTNHYGSNESSNAMNSNSSKSSIYALAVNPSGTLMASGSPEKVVRLWDPKSGKRISKLTGHTDNIRALLISDDGQYILSGSSDSTIKLWSVKAQRCITTYETHPDSVWSLYSNHPELKVFYSGSRDGLVNKTQISGQASFDSETECIGLFKEDSGVLKIAALDDTYVWTATSSSSINRWLSVPSTESRQSLPRSNFNPEIPSSALIKLPAPTSPYTSQIPDAYVPSDQLTMYAGSVLSIPTSYQEDDLDNDNSLIPLRSEPDDVIAGKPGIISHLVLQNRRHILTKDTNGEIAMWDLTKCTQIKNFGKRDIEDVAFEVNSIESFPAWCSVDTKIGAITVQLHELHCFDCEMYADEIELPEGYEVREDQRLNLGKWVLAHLFEKFIANEMEQDSIRFELDQPDKSNLLKGKPPQTPTESTLPEQVVPSTPVTTTYEQTGLEGPKLPLTAVTTDTDQSPYLPTSPQAATFAGPFTAPPSSQVQPDYFSGMHHGPSMTRRESAVQIPPPAALPNSPTSPTSSNFMNRLKNLSAKAKLTRMPTNDEKTLNGDNLNHVPLTPSANPSTNAAQLTTPINHNHLEEGQEDAEEQPNRLAEIEENKIDSYSPPSLEDFPPLNIPSTTMIIIAEESAEASTGMDLYRGTVGSLGKDADTIIEVAPSWLLSYLLYNKTPPKETVKLTFVLKPATGSTLDELPGG
ncbi:WD40-repeat-containing domain protein [Blakeslea trispora]|nr:WD40-repeat-containing domain protein [Blakeslea trispora]